MNTVSFDKYFNVTEAVCNIPGHNLECLSELEYTLRRSYNCGEEADFPFNCEYLRVIFGTEDCNIYSVEFTFEYVIYLERASTTSKHYLLRIIGKNNDDDVKIQINQKSSVHFNVEQDSYGNYFMVIYIVPEEISHIAKVPSNGKTELKDIATRIDSLISIGEQILDKLDVLKDKNRKEHSIIHHE